MKQYRKPMMNDYQPDIDAFIEECLGVPRGDELPQVGTTDDIMIGLYQDLTHQPHGYVESYLHHQVDDEITVH